MATTPADAAERLTAADASNIAIDAPDQVNAFLMAGVLAPGAPLGTDGAVDLAALRQVLSERLPAAPRMTQRVARQGRRLVWQPVTVDLTRHVREVDPVEGFQGFEALCARLIVEPLSTERPLWEVLVAPGVAPGRSGFVFRIHHAMADGLAAVRLLETLLDPVDALDGFPSVEHAGSLTTPDGSRRPRRAALTTALSGVQRTVAMFRPTVPRTILLGPLGPRRSIAFAEVDLRAVAEGAQTVGATVNDALLASVAVGVGAALSDRGEVLPATLSVSVPVALADHGRSGNAVGVMLVPVPMGRLDPADRLRQVAHLTCRRKADARSRGTVELTRTPLGARLFARLARRQRLVAMFVTNVPGPRRRLSVGGAPLERVWPVTALQGNVRLGVSALSYAGHLMCTIHADAAGVDARRVAAALAEEFARIVDLRPGPSL